MPQSNMMIKVIFMPMFPLVSGEPLLSTGPRQKCTITLHMRAPCLLLIQIMQETREQPTPMVRRKQEERLLKSVALKSCQRLNGY